MRSYVYSTSQQLTLALWQQIRANTPVISIIKRCRMGYGWFAKRIKTFALPRWRVAALFRVSRCFENSEYARSFREYREEALNTLSTKQFSDCSSPKSFSEAFRLCLSELHVSRRTVSTYTRETCGSERRTVTLRHWDFTCLTAYIILDLGPLMMGSKLKKSI